MLTAISFFLGAFALTYLIIPKIIGVVQYKKLLDHPNKRSSHTQITPTLGGVSFYFTMMICFFFLEDIDTHNVVYGLIPGLTILFIFGLKDDLVVLSPIAKLIGQLAAGCFILSNTSFRIETLGGFFGIYEVSSLVSFSFSLILIIVIINAYNLIDGIDGLAGLVGIVITLISTIIFYFLDLDFFFYMSIIVFAILSAFLRYNLSKSKKIFMGDTGSLIIGFMISLFVIKLLTLNDEIIKSQLSFNTENLPLIALAILIVPACDITRVFAIRILNKKNPFTADRKHTHHILVDLGYTHLKSSIIVALFNLFFASLIIVLSFFLNYEILSSFIFLVFFGIVYLFFNLDSSYSNTKKKVNLRNRQKKIKEKLGKKRNKNN